MSLRWNALAGSTLLIAAAIAGCGGDGDNTRDNGVDDIGNPDNGNGTDLGTDTDMGTETDMGTDSGVEPLAAITEVDDVILAAANDLRGVIFAADGKIYASGHTDVNASDRQTVVVRLDADGTLDDGFGDEGVVVLNVSEGGTESSLALVELENGDVVVAVNASDNQGGAAIPDVDGFDPGVRASGQDIVLVRLDDEGEPVANGEFTVNLGWAPADDATWPVPTYTSTNSAQTRYSHAGFPTDTAWDLQVDRSGETERLVLFAIGSPVKVESGMQRVDNDRYIVRLNLDGSIDPTFNGGELFTFHSEGVLGDNTRRGLVEADGSIVSSGYTNFGTGLGNHVVIIRLLPNGTPDTNFGFGFASARPGVARFNPFVVDGGAAEAYGVVRLSNGTYVTTGYGGATATTTASSLGYAMTVLQDVVSFGFTATGLSAGFGDSGRFVQQSESQVPAVANTEDRGRHIAVLPDDRMLQVGRFGGVTAIFVVLPDGTLDTSVGEGGRFLYPSIPSQFFGVAVSADGTRIVATSDAHANGAGVAILQVGAP